MAADGRYSQFSGEEDLGAIQMIVCWRSVFRLTLIAVALALVCLPIASAGAQDGTKAKPVKAGVDPYLARTRGRTREEYIYNLFRNFRPIAGSDQVLERKEIEQQRQKRLANARANRIRDWLQHDLDGDGVIKLEEVRKSTGVNLSRSRFQRRRSSRKLSEFQRADDNRDGSLTFFELLKGANRVLSFGSRARTSDQSDQLLALDPNGDGRLTAQELETVGRAAFAFFDRDGDGVLSRAEERVKQRARQSARRKPVIRPNPRLISGCVLPKPEGAEVILVSAYEAGALSTVTVAGQDRETETSVLIVEPGTKPLYVVATTQKPMIWRVTGDVARVKRFVAIPGNRNGASAGVGVVGLDKNRISFMPTGSCMYPFKSAKSRAAREAKVVLKTVLGQPVGNVVAKYSLVGASLPSGVAAPSGRDGRSKLTMRLGNGKEITVTRSGKVVGGNSRANPKLVPRAPHGVDAATIRELYRSRPAGVIAIDPKSVVAPTPVAAYEVLPQEAGLVQLMQAGKIERLPDGYYKIKQPIPRYPPNLTGAHSVKFLLAKGVPEPKGEPGHSCVVSEATGEVLYAPGRGKKCN